jgi:hypothetical protein
MKKSNVLPALAFIISFALPFLVIWYKIDYMPFVWAGASICLFVASFALYQTALEIWVIKDDGYIGLFIAAMLMASAAAFTFSVTLKSFYDSL